MWLPEGPQRWSSTEADGRTKTRRNVDAATGEQQWFARYWGEGIAYPVGITTGPSGEAVYVNGHTRQTGSTFGGAPFDHWDMATVKYAG